MKKVTGIGGIFFKCKDPKAINEWYKAHLGFDTSPYGTSFEWREIDDMNVSIATTEFFLNLVKLNLSL